MPVLWMCALLPFYSFILFCVGRKIIVLEVFILRQLLPAWFFIPENKTPSNIIPEAVVVQRFFLKRVGSGLANTFFYIASSIFVYQALKLNNSLRNHRGLEAKCLSQDGRQYGTQPSISASTVKPFCAARQMCT